MTLHPPSPALRQRLQRLHSLSPEYGRQLSSHLPMALAALDALGADAERLEQFEVRYRAGHPLAEQPPPGRALRDWAGLLGLHDSLPDLRASLRRLLDEHGPDALVALTLPTLLESPGSVAFHGLIRVAHALESAVDAELVEALAYWGCRWQPLPLAPAAQPPIADPGTWLQTLDEARREQPDTPDSDLPLIAQRMFSLTREPAWRGHAARLDLAAQPAGDLLAGLARACAQRYRRSRNFTVLHMVTGLRAAAVLHERAPLPAAAWPRLRDALAAVSLVSGLWRSAPATVPPDPQPGDWATLAQQACAQDDDHVVKLVHALRWWDLRQPDPLWRLTAARALQA